MSEIIVRPAASHEYARILKIALAGVHASPAEASRISKATLGYLARCGGTVGGLHLAELAGQVVAVCAAMDLQGAVSLLMVPPWSLSSVSLEAMPDLLRAAGIGAQERGKRFAQVILEGSAAAHARPQMEAAGFASLATLHYMQRDAFGPAPAPATAVTWRTLRESDESTFSDVIRRTYVGSLDCPGLTGIRTMEEIVAGHKSAGEFDPDGWFLMQHEGCDVGVMLTTRMAFRQGLEVAYCGLVPTARGKGLGRVCVHKAIMRARDLAILTVTLAVDSNNAPARRIYDAMGFCEYASRDIWIKVFCRADAQGQFELPTG